MGGGGGGGASPVEAIAPEAGDSWGDDPTLSVDTIASVGSLGADEDVTWNGDVILEGEEPEISCELLRLIACVVLTTAVKAWPTGRRQAKRKATAMTIAATNIRSGARQACWWVARLQSRFGGLCTRVTCPLHSGGRGKRAAGPRCTPRRLSI